MSFFREHKIFSFTNFFKLIALLFAIIEIAFLSRIIFIDIWFLQAMVLICVFLIGYGVEINKNLVAKKFLSMVLHIILGIFGISACIYLLFEIPRLQWAFGSAWTRWDIIFGTLLIISSLELARKKFGLALPLIALVSILYALFGNLLPSHLFGHAGFSYNRVISFLFGSGGMFGLVFGVFVKIIFLFMLFGAFLNATGIGNYLVDLSYAVAGKWRGGPAKVAVVASALLGMINGNSVANVATTGSITIPLMKKVGYNPSFAGAVEAVASTGGQILPPVMGAGAFIMAEFLQISYSSVVIVAIVPAILYFLGVFLMVDLEAVRLDLKGSKSEDKASTVILSRLHLIIPILLLVYLLVITKVSVARAGLLTIASCVIVSWFNKKGERMGPKKFIVALIEGADSTVSIAAICTVAGVVTGILGMTGLANRFTALIVGLAGNNTLLVCAFTALVVMILGMGLPTTASYIIGMSIGVPSLVAIGITPIAAHLFVFYYACLSAITPPVGGAFYAASAIADAPVMRTGILSVKLGIGAYIVPFFFVFSPELLLQGAFIQMIQPIITSVIGIICISVALEGIFFTRHKIMIWQRIFLAVAAVCLFDPKGFTDIVGIVIIAVCLGFSIVYQAITKKKPVSG